MVKGKMKSLLVILAVGTLVVMGVAALIMFNLPQLPMSAVYLVMGMGVVEEILILCVTCYYRKHEDFNANVTNMQNVAFSRASRDIRTLMNSILNFSSPELIENYNPQEMLNSLTKINNAGLYLMTVVDDLMATYHVSDQQIVLKENPTTIENVFNPIVELVTERFISKNQVFDVEYINIDKFRYVLVDAPRVQQIVMNLLTNANKYTPEGGHILFRVEGVSGEGESLDITITVKDNGQGMSKRKLNNLFKADPKQTFDKGHYELGLAIVASLVKQMNGTISCTSQENQGSEFVVKFQWTYCHKNSFASTIRDFSVLRGKNILVVEDNEMNAEITKAILEKKGMMMDYAKDGAEGVAMFTHAMPHTYDAILMDIRMPVMDGIEACKKIRYSTHPESSIIPIIAMTADVFEADYQSSTDAGMDGYITKPLDPEELYITLSNAIRSQGLFSNFFLSFHRLHV